MNLGKVPMIAAICIFATAKAGAVDWEQHRILLSGSVLTLSFPKGESNDFFKHAMMTEVDINDDTKYDKWFSAINLFEKYWDYNKFLVPGSLGSLHAIAMVRALPANTNANALDPSELKQAIVQRLQHSRDEENQRLIQKGNVALTDALPTEFTTKSLNGKEWLQYHISGRDDTDAYVAGIDKTHYVEIHFSFIDNSRGNKSDWRERAAADEMKIMASATLLRSSH